MVSSSIQPLTVDHLLRLQAEQIPDVPLISYPKHVSNFRQYTSRHLNIFAYRAAKRYAKLLSSRDSSSSPEQVVALLGASNFDYIVSIFALSKLGITILFLSPRISDEAYRHLLDKTGCAHMIVQMAFEKAAARVKAGFPSKPLSILRMVESGVFDPDVLPKGEELLSVGDMRFDMRFDLRKMHDKNVWIIHSSGSTGLPKPIGQSHRQVLNSAFSSSNQTLSGLLTVPLFHTYGLFVMISSIMAGRVMSIWNAELPITGANMIEVLETVRPGILYSVPYTLKLMAETGGGIDALKICKLVVFGGSSCPDELGNRLTREGISLLIFYGSTECGSLMRSAWPASDLDWDYLKLMPNVLPYAQWAKSNGNLYELVLLDGCPSKVAANRPDGSYATHDLFEPHRADPHKWKFVGRLDDTIVLSNGEKANPVSIENSVRDNQYVSQVICVGVQKPQLGLLIIPSEKAGGMGRDEVIEKIWPSIEAGNVRMPAYAKISSDMIGFLPPGTRCPSTDKGTIIRAAFYKTFGADIEAMYASYEEQNVMEGLELSEEETKTFIRGAIRRVLKLEDSNVMRDDTDFFSLGLDSLGAMRVAETIRRELSTGKPIGQNIAFEKPTVEKLGRFLYRLRTGEKADEGSEVIEVMKGLVKKYSQFQPHTPGNSDMEGDYIVSTMASKTVGSFINRSQVVTGASGSLGAHIVSQLVVKDSVRKVYCLVRANNLDNAQQRVTQSLQDRRVYKGLSGEALAKIVSFPSDLSQENLGLAPEVYEELLENITTVIHSAWQVNFNMDVSSFENDLIKGSYNLITLCLKSRRPHPTPFNFCSSISTVTKTTSPTIPETLPSYDHALPMGYAHSKLATERLCALAAKQTSITTRILRIGQICGDTTHGVWNATEAIPLAIRSATMLGALPCPTNDETLSWLPVDDAAAAIIDLSDTTPAKDNFAVFHVSHPKTLSWNTDLLPGLRKAGLQFDAVPPTEWVKRLRASNQDPAVNPPIKLLEFFEARYASDEVRSGPHLQTTEACRLSKSLRETKQVDAELIGRFLGYWRGECW